MGDDEMRKLDVREKLAHIDLMMAQHDRTRQGNLVAPWLAVISGLSTGWVRRLIQR